LRSLRACLPKPHRIARREPASSNSNTNGNSQWFSIGSRRQNSPEAGEKLRGHHGITIDTDDKDEDADLRKMRDFIAIPIVAIVFLSIFGAPVLIVIMIGMFTLLVSRMRTRPPDDGWRKVQPDRQTLRQRASGASRCVHPMEIVNIPIIITISTGAPNIDRNTIATIGIAMKSRIFRRSASSSLSSVSIVIPW